MFKAVEYDRNGRDVGYQKLVCMPCFERSQSAEAAYRQWVVALPQVVARSLRHLGIRGIPVVWRLDPPEVVEVLQVGTYVETHMSWDSPVNTTRPFYFGLDGEFYEDRGRGMQKVGLVKKLLSVARSSAGVWHQDEQGDAVTFLKAVAAAHGVSVPSEPGRYELIWR